MGAPGLPGVPGHSPRASKGPKRASDRGMTGTERQAKSIVIYDGIRPRRGAKIGPRRARKRSGKAFAMEDDPKSVPTRLEEASKSQNRNRPERKKYSETGKIEESGFEGCNVRQVLREYNEITLHSAYALKLQDVNRICDMGEART